LQLVLETLLHLNAGDYSAVIAKNGLYSKRESTGLNVLLDDINENTSSSLEDSIRVM